ncbi:hypothetical protein [Luteolibacter luteus]|uniref:Uncharacterized protein n=1 Tax=Luteolibacter luteus TaxID=2728835 RepID=A0A858RII4_9BACT|nr:hypothetical protein [Luteolibacter luteus]QJE96717.1 hypothetical protein HHL09_13305 [Luteolibacter luteus]
MAVSKPASLILPTFLYLAATSQASAGMTVITLTDMARARLDALSFFLFAFFLVSWGVKLLWNYLAKTFTALPVLNYRKALGVVTISGLLFYVVLTMISGARELLTPGAWEKQGVGYRTREGGVAYLSKEERREALRDLQGAIWAYAEEHEGKAPAGPLVEGIEPQLWRFKGGGLYCLMPEVRPGGGRQVLVYEPSTAGGRRFVLLADGTIEDRAEGTLKKDIDEQLR